MTTIVQARTARKPRKCDSCHWSPSLWGVATIAPGHRYLRHVAFPDSEWNTSGRPLVNTECVSCACERESSNGLLVARACSSYCCSDVPCALPFKHDGDHSCRRCYLAGAGMTRPPHLDPSRSAPVCGPGGTGGAP